MDTKYLSYVLTIAKKRNMTKAAEELYVSQSSLSQYVTKLEQEIGTPLFFRAKGELTLTPAGELYMKAAEEVLLIKNRLYQNISNLDKRGHITVGTTSQFGLRMLTEIIPEYKKQFPDVSIDITEIGLPLLKKMLVEETVDLGIMATTTLVPFEGQADILRNEEVFFAIPIDHPYCKKNTGHPIHAEELIKEFADASFCMSRKGSSLQMVTDDFFSGYEFTPFSLCETNNVSASRSMVANNGCVAFIAESNSHNRDKIAYYSLEPKRYRYNLMVRRKNWVMNEPEQVLCSYLKNYFPLNQENPYLA